MRSDRCKAAAYALWLLAVAQFLAFADGVNCNIPDLAYVSANDIILACAGQSVVDENGHLVQINANVQAIVKHSVTVIDLPHLHTVTGFFKIFMCNRLTTLVVPELASVGNHLIVQHTALQYLSMGSLATLGGNFWLDSNSQLTHVTLALNSAPGGTFYVDNVASGFSIVNCGTWDLPLSDHQAHVAYISSPHLDFDHFITQVDAACCSSGQNCGNGVLTSCTAECRAVVIPLYESCADEIGAIDADARDAFTAAGDLCGATNDECFPDPCLNGGNCLDGVFRYTCVCPAGFVGDQCETDIDECASAPCRNNGVCVDSADWYACVCLDGWRGMNCDATTDDCNSSPCKNDAVCFDRQNAYDCRCIAGYSGENCAETSMDPCESAPCDPNGSSKCTDEQFNGYSCTCLSGWFGLNCADSVGSGH